MRLFSFAKSFFRSLFRRQEMDTDLDNEIRSAAALLADQKIKEGIPPEAARRAARIELGGIEQVKEEVRSGRVGAWLESFLGDLLFGLRMLRRSPGFTAVVVLTLALGIGVNTAVFSLVNSILLRPLPIHQPSEVVFLVSESKTGGVNHIFSYPEFLKIQEQTSKIFSGITTLYSFQMDGVSEGGTSRPIWTTYVAGDFFNVLGMTPALGRLILPSEGSSAGADPVLVVSYAFWKSRFNADPNIVGKEVTVNGRPMIVVGVAPEGFRGLTSLLEMQGYMPLGMAVTLKDAPEDLLTNSEVRGLAVIARLRPGIDLPEAQSELRLAAQRLSQHDPNFSKLLNFRAVPLGPAGLAINPEHPEALSLVSALFLALAASVLVLACVNIANLLLVRSDARQREMAMRTALGAAPVRLIRHLLTESILVALAGGTAGVLLGLAASQTISSIPLHAPFPVVLDFSFDWRVFAYAFGAAVLTGMLVGVGPAIRAARGDVMQVLHEGGRTSTPGRKRLGTVLVVAEIGGSLMLLIIAGLFVRSLERVEHSDLGFDPSGVLNVSLDPHAAGYNPARATAFLRDVVGRARSLPGVESASLAFSVPMDYLADGTDFTVQGQKSPTFYAGYDVISAGYFRTMRIPLLRGRDFLESDSEDAPHVAIISQAMADRCWPGQDPLGRLFTTTSDPKHPLEIVGIVGNIRRDSLQPATSPFFYMPLAQAEEPSIITLQVRTTSRPETMAREVTGLIQALDPAMPTFDVEPMTAAFETLNGFLLFQFAAGLTACLGILALLLAVVGVYGVISYAAARRTHEIGIRMALGAQAADVLKMIFRHGLAIVSAGVLFGFVAAAGLARIVGNFLMGVPPLDPLTYFAAALVLAAVALTACYIPARRAMKVDPVVALRQE